MVRVIYKKFHEVRWHIRLNQLKNRSASKIQQKILGAIAMKGGSEEPRERIIIRSKQILNFLVLAKRDLMVETAQDKLLSFIQETRQKNQLFQKFKKMIYLGNTSTRDSNKLYYSDQNTERVESKNSC